jgi:hypothetical protein
MSQTKPSFAKNVAGVVSAIAIGITFFFAIIGVFGLAVAMASLALAILLAAVIIRRAPGGEDLL